ncbi:MAG: hypothetical protein ABH828_04860 [archaeon]
MKQKLIHATNSNPVFVADMHELVEPNKEARAIWNNLNGKMPSDKELSSVYNNSVDPLIEIIKNNKPMSYTPHPLYAEKKYPTYVVSLGDMVVNRVNFGTGTEKSIIGKLGKKAREIGVPQHEFIADNYKEHLGEIEDWAYRNSFWTEKRFNRIKGIANLCKFPVFIHLNGNADTLSSYVTREILNADFKSPNEIFEDYFRWEGKMVFAKDKPKIISFDNNICQSGKFRLTSPDFDMDDEPDDLEYKWSGGYSIGKEEYPSVVNDVDLQTVLIPHTLEWKTQTAEVEKLLKESKLKPRNSMLLIHEPLSYEPFTKSQNIEGIEAYRRALNLMPPETVVVHGHTHAKDLVKYEFEGHRVYQVPPNTGVHINQIK